MGILAFNASDPELIPFWVFLLYLIAFIVFLAIFIGFLVWVWKYMKD